MMCLWKLMNSLTGYVLYILPSQSYVSLVAFESVLLKMHYMGIVFKPLPVACLRFVP